MWDLIVSVPDQCLSFYFLYLSDKVFRPTEVTRFSVCLPCCCMF